MPSKPTMASSPFLCRLKDVHHPPHELRCGPGLVLRSGHRPPHLIRHHPPHQLQLVLRPHQSLADSFSNTGTGSESSTDLRSNTGTNPHSYPDTGIYAGNNPSCPNASTDICTNDTHSRPDASTTTTIILPFCLLEQYILIFYGGLPVLPDIQTLCSCNGDFTPQLHLLAADGSSSLPSSPTTAKRPMAEFTKAPSPNNMLARFTRAKLPPHHPSQLRRPSLPSREGAKDGGNNLTTMLLETTISLLADKDTSGGTSGHRIPPSNAL
nr:unnamed protein product [Digitaria exilis]